MAPEFDYPRIARQLASALESQDAVNRTIAADWIDRRFGWHRGIAAGASGIALEAAAGDFGRARRCDPQTIRDALIAIWPLALSWWIVRFGQPVDSEALLAAAMRRLAAGVDAARHCLPEALERVTGTDPTLAVTAVMADRMTEAAGAGRFDATALVCLMGLTGLEFDALFRAHLKDLGAVVPGAA